MAKTNYQYYKRHFLWKWPVIMQSKGILLFAYLQGRCRWAHKQHIFEWRHQTCFKGKWFVVTPALKPPWFSFGQKGTSHWENVPSFLPSAVCTNLSSIPFAGLLSPSDAPGLDIAMPAILSQPSSCIARNNQTKKKNQKTSMKRGEEKEEKGKKKRRRKQIRELGKKSRRKEF